MSVVVDRALTQSVNVGSVTLPATTATQVLAANSNRVKVTFNVSGTTFLGVDNTVTNNTGVNSSSFNNVLDWQTAIWAYSSPGGSIAYAEEVLS